MILSKKSLLILIIVGLSHPNLNQAAEAGSDKHAPKEKEKKIKETPRLMPSRLKTAIELGDTGAVIKHLTIHPDDSETVDAEYGLTPLLYAFGEIVFLSNQKISPALLMALIERTRNLEAVDRFGITALMQAAEFAPLAVVQALVSKKANVNAIDNDGQSVLMHAARALHEHNKAQQQDQLRVIQFLIHSGAHLDNINELLQASFDAVNPDVVIFLLSQKGVDLNALDKEGNPIFWRALAQFKTFKDDFDPAEYAIRQKKLIAILEMLLKNGANLQTRNRHDETVLIHFSGYCSLDAVKFLVEHKADIYATQHNRYSPLDRAIDNYKMRTTKEHAEECDKVITYLRKIYPSYKKSKDYRITTETQKALQDVKGMEKEAAGSIVGEFIMGSEGHSKKIFNGAKTALATGNIGRLKKLITNNPIILEDTDEAGETLLMIAVKRNNLPALQRILRILTLKDAENRSKIATMEKELKEKSKAKTEDVGQLEEDLAYQKENFELALKKALNAQNHQGQTALAIARTLDHKGIITILEPLYAQVEKE